MYHSHLQHFRSRLTLCERDHVVDIISQDHMQSRKHTWNQDLNVIREQGQSARMQENIKQIPYILKNMHSTSSSTATAISNNRGCVQPSWSNRISLVEEYNAGSC
jgi:hypothetical protein